MERRGFQTDSAYTNRIENKTDLGMSFNFYHTKIMIAPPTLTSDYLSILCIFVCSDLLFINPTLLLLNSSQLAQAIANPM
jgi:hypothetical protein